MIRRIGPVLEGLLPFCSEVMNELEFHNLPFHRTNSREDQGLVVKGGRVAETNISDHVAGATSGY